MLIWFFPLIFVEAELFLAHFDPWILRGAVFSGEKNKLEKNPKHFGLQKLSDK